MVYNIALGCVSVIVGYYKNIHKPRYISLGVLVMVVGAVIVSLPKFVMGDYVAGTVSIITIGHLEPSSFSMHEI